MMIPIPARSYSQMLQSVSHLTQYMDPGSKSLSMSMDEYEVQPPIYVENLMTTCHKDL